MPGRSNATFISVLTPPTVSDGDLVFGLDTINAETNLSLTVSVTGIVSTDSEVDVAVKIETQLNTALTSYAYIGYPVWSSDTVQANFRVARADHVVSIWSQCEYRLIIDNNTTGSFIKVNKIPIFSTIAYATEYASSIGYCFLDANGNSMTNEQIAMGLLKQSSEIVKFLKHFGVVTTYYNHFRGNGTKSVMTRPTPGIDKDILLVKRKYPRQGPVFAYTGEDFLNWLEHTGELNYIGSNNIVNTNSPFANGNEIILTFTVGFYTIPEELTMILVELVFFEANGDEEIASLSGGSFNIKTATSTKNKLLGTLGPWRSMPSW